MSTKILNRTLRVDVTHSANPDDAASWFADAAVGAAGWVETHRELRPWAHGDPPPAGRVLRAEWAAGDESVHVVFDGEKWIHTRLREVDQQGAVMLEHRYLSTTADRKMLVYRTAWLPRVDGEDDKIEILEPGPTRFVRWEAKTE